MGGKIVRIMPKDSVRPYLHEKSMPKFGKTKNEDKSIDGKVIVYMDDGTKMLVAPFRLKIMGFYD